VWSKGTPKFIKIFSEIFRNAFPHSVQQVIGEKDIRKVILSALLDSTRDVYRTIEKAFPKFLITKTLERK
jgi:hypothetical protein